MAYTLFDNTGNSSNYSANPNDPIQPSQVTYSTGNFASVDDNEFELRVGGQRFDDFTEGDNRNTYTVVNSFSNTDDDDDDENILEIKYDKDDDGRNQDIDAVRQH